jgi:NDP-sugar pyrophosphorylase family protein
MNYAILSAGEGSRLRNESVNVPKPLISIAGKPMFERLLSIFWDNNAESIYIITNLEPEIKDFLEEIQNKTGNKLHVIYKETPSSAHSFYELIPYLQDKKFCLTTVDTIFRPEEFTNYINEFEANKEIDGLMAVTSYIDDESPLYVETDEEMNIIGFHDQNNGKCKYVSGGMYAFNSSVIALVEKASKKGITRMRNLQRELIENGLKLKAYPFSKILDVDHVSDIQKAEEFLAP